MASTPDARRAVRGGNPRAAELGAAVPEGAGPAAVAPTNQLDFYQAMVDFRVMFPNMDEEIIEAVLRANNGAVDATIDQLLTMNVDVSAEPQVPPAPAAAMDPPGYASVVDSRPRPKKAPRQKSLADSTSSEDEDDPPPYPPPSYHTYTTSSAGRAGRDYPARAAAASLPRPPHPMVDPSYSAPSKPVSRPKEAQPRDILMSRLTASGPRPKGPAGEGEAAKAKQSSFLDDFFTPEPSFDPFDDEFFRTPAAPKASPPKEEAPTSAQLEELPKKGLYRQRWNPPMLGDLPDDFLRIMVEVPVAPSEASPGSGAGSPGSAACGKKKGKSRPRTSSGDHSPSHKAQTVPRGSSFAGLTSEVIAARMAENNRQRSQLKANPEGKEQSQMLQDEMLALYLQNEEFLEDLRMDEDFMKALERERMNATAFEQSGDGPELDPNRHQHSQQEGYGDDEVGEIGAFPFDKDVPESDKNDELRMQLKHMGASSKKRMVTLARRFFRTKKKKSSKQILKESSLGPSKANLLEDDDAEPGAAMASLREDSESNLTLHQYH